MINRGDRAVADAPYLRIVADLRDDIAAGRLRDGDLLPSLAELAEQYRVSSPTVQKAMRALIAEGLAEGVQGVGTFVRVWRPIVRVVPDRLARATGWGAGRAIQDHDTGGRSRLMWVAVDQVDAPEVVAELLDVPAGTRCVTRARLFAVDGRPVQLATSWIPADLAVSAGLDGQDTGPGGMWARLADIGHAPAGPAAERWRVRPADQVERETLKLPPAARVLEGRRAVRDASGRVVDLAVMVLAEGAYELEFRFDL